MLHDAAFQRTPRCNFYSSFLKDRDNSIPQIPLDRITASDASSARIFSSTGFNKPFLIVDSGKEKKLGLQLPDRMSTDLSGIAEIVGNDMPIRIIEVGRQNEITDYTISEYANYLKNYTDKHKVLNMISLEFSATPLNAKVHSPHFVRSMDWIDVLWPLNRRARADYPQVQKYCLAGMAGSYTDFHIDFGGTSVWYHILHGRKRFYFVAPTIENLNAFANWTCSAADTNRGAFFFGDWLPPGQCMAFDLTPGETLVIPSGWIHSVFTPEDSLVFGGNFVHSFSILRQLQVNAIEERTHVKKAYRFPYFRQINWYFLCALLPVVHERYMKVSIASKEQQLRLQHEAVRTARATKIGIAAAAASVDVSVGAVDAESDDNVSSGDCNTEDDEEEDDDLILLAKQLILPAVFNQLPYLVKSCDLWLKSKPVEANEEQLFRAAAEEAGYSTPAEVVGEWWDVLKHLAALIAIEIHYKSQLAKEADAIAASAGAALQNGSMQQQQQQPRKKAFEPTRRSENFPVLSSWQYQHVLRIQRMTSLDLLSEDVVYGVDPEFDRYVRSLRENNCNNNSNDNISININSSNTNSEHHNQMQSQPILPSQQDSQIQQGQPPQQSETEVNAESFDSFGFIDVPEQRPTATTLQATSTTTTTTIDVAEKAKRKSAASNKAAARKLIRS